MSAKMEVAELLTNVIRDDPKEVEFLPLNQVMIEGVRQNDKRPAWVKASVPDSWVVNLMKNEKLLDGFILARVSREFIDKFIASKKERSDESTVNPEQSVSGELRSEDGEGSVSG